MSTIRRWFKIQGEVDKFYWRSYKAKGLWIPFISLWVLSFILLSFIPNRLFLALGTLSFIVGLSVMITDILWVKATKGEEFKNIKMGGTL
jgi:hypothetical protein